MLIPELDRAAIIRSNSDEYGPDAAAMKWLSPQDAANQKA